MIDLLKDRDKLLELYRPGTQDFTLVDVPELPFAVIDGEGPPEQGAAPAIKALYQAILPIRRQARERAGKAFVEPPVEMLYRTDDPEPGAGKGWKWRVMVTLPAWADADTLAASVATAREHMDAAAPSPVFERFAEGRCAQILHVGRTDDIPAMLERLHGRFMPDHGLEPAGAWHEIYLDDWNRVAREQRRIILRQPVRPRAGNSHHGSMS
ncbi:MAG: GyrI-like domain-containing protein [Rhizobiaceae bacterium]